MRVQILSTSGCAGCAAAKQIVQRVAADYPGLAVEEVDVFDEPEVAVRHGLLSAPGVVVDDELIASGHVREADLRRTLDQHARR